jgi:hypothetical protein
MPILFIFLPLFPFYFFLSGNREINLPFTRWKNVKEIVKSRKHSKMKETTQRHSSLHASWLQSSHRKQMVWCAEDASPTENFNCVVQRFCRPL